MKQMNFEELVELIAHSRYIAAISDSHAEVLKANRQRVRYQKIAYEQGFDLQELRKKVLDKYLDLYYDKV